MRDMPHPSIQHSTNSATKVYYAFCRFQLGTYSMHMAYSEPKSSSKSCHQWSSVVLLFVNY